MDTDFIDSFRRYQKTGNFWGDLNPLTKLNVCLALAFSALIMMDYRYGLPLILVVCIIAALSGKFVEFIKLFGRLTLIIVVFVTLIRQIGMRTTPAGIEMRLRKIGSIRPKNTALPP